MKICQEAIDCSKLVTRQDCQIRFLPAGFDYSLSVCRGLERASGRRSYSNDAAATNAALIDYRRSLFPNFKKLRSNVMLVNVVDAHRFKCSVADMQR